MTTGTNALDKIIANEIKHHQGALSFARFMALALYHPQYGYYMQPGMQLGKKGDFTTAPEISPLFAQCFASLVHATLQQTGFKHIAELGAGSGRFAGDFLTELALLNALPTHYYICEISPALQAQQASLLQTAYPAVAHLVTWVDHLPASFEGVVIGNEVLDALPVHCFQLTESSDIKERCVTLDGDHFAWTLATPTTPLLTQAALQLCDRYHLPNGYYSEIHLAIDTFIPALLKSIKRGVLFWCDYGYGEAEYYHPQRQKGTLSCFYQHQYHDNPLFIPGHQDITAHVNFTRLIETAHAHDAHLLGYTTQAGFLLSLDIIERATRLEHQLSAIELFALQQQIKTLTMPTEMGERIKLMALAKHCEPHLPYFTMPDRRREL